jgi:hypothetical protein
MLSLHSDCLVALLISTAAAAMTNPIPLRILQSPPAGTQTLTGQFQGYSMEMASFASIAGNISYVHPAKVYTSFITDGSSPNKLSYRMLQNLKDITGSAAPIRVGGTTANHGIWAPNQKEAIIQNFAVAGADQPANVTWGPAYLESFKTFPKGTHYTVGVTFGDGLDGEEATVTGAKAFYDGIGSELFAIEVGNEFDGKNPYI